MISKKEISLLFLFLTLAILLFWIDLNTGDLQLTWNVLIQFRSPRVISAFVAGGGLAVAGLLLQTLFNNNLAGPYVLGINSGSSLFVAFGILVNGAVTQSIGGIFSASILGAMIYSLIILSFSNWVKSKNTLLLIGVMLGSFTGSIISVIQQHATAESIRSFTIWSMGSLQTADLIQSIWMLIGVFLTFFCTLLISKPLNILLTGDINAMSLGVNVKRLRFYITLFSSLFTGIVTAFCGPIAFVGLAIPNLVRKISKSRNHFYLLISCLLVGSCVMLSCDILLQYIDRIFVLPLNALTAIIGAPIVISILLKKN
jgi:iron complex transport system permease protein